MKSFHQNQAFPSVLEVYHTLNRAGYKTLFVGGCVRDGLLGRVPQDFDLVSEALPEQVDECFDKTLSVGKEFLISMVVHQGYTVEVATFRKEENYGDGRRPQQVQPATAQEDALRRDFTMNGLFFDWDQQSVIDYVNGQADIQSGLIRCIGRPEIRFQEDHLRLLRAFRFVSQLGFQIESLTFQALLDLKSLLTQVSLERKTQEVEKILQGEFLNLVSRVWVEKGFLQEIFPGCTELNQDDLTKIQNFSKLFPAWDLEVQELVTQKSSEIRWVLWADALGFSLEPRPEELFRLSKSHLALWKEYYFWKHQPRVGAQAGPLLERLAKPASRLGFFCAGGGAGPEDLKPLFSKLESWMGRVPGPWVKSSDIPDGVQGARLGEILKSCYWAQLEGVVSTPEQALGLAQRLAHGA
jgi:tRNA nucleotidyltransferase/poly(A) polymerase